jgi:flagellar motor switch/type III secretory pathway protein FliN
MSLLAKSDPSQETTTTPSGRGDSHASNYFQGKPSAWAPVINHCAKFSTLLANTFESFWGVPTQVEFLSISTENLYFYRYDDFHVSQISVSSDPEATSEKNKSGSKNKTDGIIQLRLSDATCSSLLTQVLGQVPTDSKQIKGDHFSFKFKRITEFEAQVLNQYTKEIFGTLMKHFIQKTPPVLKDNPSQHNPSAPKHTFKPTLINLIWTLQVNVQPSKVGPLPCGKIILTLPSHLIKIPQGYDELDPKPVLSEHLIEHAHLDATLMIGKAQVRLEELEALEAEDLIVLQDSDINKLYLLSPRSSPEEEHPPHKFPFQAKILDPQSIRVPHEQEMEMMENQQSSTATKQNLWDNLMIDVSAEFFPSKLPLSHLKQMTEGLVVEIADLIHNRVRVLVEGKQVAVGELVIVGDKFGVRVISLDESDSPEFTPRGGGGQLTQTSGDKNLTPQHANAQTSGNSGGNHHQTTADPHYSEPHESDSPSPDYNYETPQPEQGGEDDLDSYFNSLDDDNSWGT